MAPPVYNTDRPLGLPGGGRSGALRPTSWCWRSARTRSRSGEGRSQADIGLKGLQDELLRAVLEVNKKVVVVLMSGRPLAIAHVAEAVPALLEAWLLGSQAGHAIADVLFGDYNPSGKLPASFPRAVGQEPLYYDHKNTGRPGPEPGVTWSHYTDVPNEPLYPFGFGLSYTTFSYSEPRLSAAEIGRDGQLQVSVTVTNSGKRAGAEVVPALRARPRRQRDAAGQGAEGLREGRAPARAIARGRRSRSGPPTSRSTRARGRWEAEPGAFKVFVGGNSRDVKEAAFTCAEAGNGVGSRNRAFDVMIQDLTPFGLTAAAAAA